MTTDKEFVLQTMRDTGLSQAQRIQAEAPDMSGTELYAEEVYVPGFKAAVALQNMLERKAGFVCRSTAGRLVKLLQPYDSTIYTAEPEELPAQWGFYWSTDPAKALPFIALSTSPYMIGDCCTENGKTWRSTIDNNVWSPSSYAQGWEEVTGEETTEPDPDPGTDPAPETYPEWVQPTGGHDAYSKGDRVTYQGKVYESTIDSNAWSPDTYPQGWKEITE